MSTIRFISLFVVCACGGQPDVPNGGQPDSATDSNSTMDGAPIADSSTPDTTAPDGGASLLAQLYPGDKGIGADPSVVWDEHFDEGSVSAVTARYESSDNVSAMTIVSDHPAASSVKVSMQFTADPSAGNNGPDLYKNFAKFSKGYDELYYRWYVKYEPNIEWHHAGLWIGGYDPPQDWAAPHAGMKPAGNDRFSIAVEPVWGVGTSTPQLDFYNYWMNMHTCSSCSGSYWGNSLVEQTSLTTDDGQWVCMELHVKLNTDMASAAGSMLEIWKNDKIVQSFTATGPSGGWIQDHYCPQGSTAPQCAGSATNGPANIQVRTQKTLNLNYFWPQSYVTTGGAASMWYSNMVVATKRIGCIVP
jgi:hypothetical protein